MRRGDTDEQYNTPKGRQIMGSNNINTHNTTNNAGFPPAPPETRQQAGVVKQSTISLRAMRYCIHAHKTVWVL
jgi:hypothetical protein